MGATISYPTSGNVPASFPVGGTYETIGDPKVPTYAVIATLYDSDGNQLDQQSCPAVSGSWSGTLTDPSPPHEDCYVTAQLVEGGKPVGNPDEVEDLDT